jgi:hypothetical protein
VGFYVCLVDIYRGLGGTFWLHLQDRPTPPTIKLNFNLCLIMVAKSITNATLHIKKTLFGR